MALIYPNECRTASCLRCCTGTTLSSASRAILFGVVVQVAVIGLRERC
ncbi:hypothetical protein ABL850_22715 [Variovorax paradoxus]